VPPFLGLLCSFLKKLLYAVAFPVMSMISSILAGRREAGNLGIPVWVDFIEGVFEVFEKFFNKMIRLTRKRKRHNGWVKKGSFYAAVALAVLLTAAIVNNPNEWYAVTWQKTESWLNQEKPGVQLGLNPVEPTTKAAAPALKEYVLNEQYKDGGNIREEPNLSASPLYTIAVGETVYSMDEERVDSRGIKWLKVKTADGKVIGWISANIVREK
jgi:hypothetical protein